MSKGEARARRRVGFLVMAGLVVALFAGVGAVVWTAAPGDAPRVAEPAELSSVGDVKLARRKGAAKPPEVPLPPDPTSAARLTSGERITTEERSASRQDGVTESDGTAPVVASDPGAATDAVAARGATRLVTRSGAETHPTPDRTLVVHVTAAESDKPIVGAVVTVTAKGLQPTTLTTGTGGLIAFAATGATSAEVDVKSPRRVRVSRRAVALTSRETTLHVVLERGVLVRGTVSGPKGPIAGATVRAVDWKALLASVPYDPVPAPIDATTTDRRGTYRLDCIPRGVECGLLVGAEGCETDTRWIPAQPDVDHSVRADVELGTGGLVTGAVTDEHGRPVAGAQVFAYDRVFLDIQDGVFRGMKDAVELALLDALRDHAQDCGLPASGRTSSGEDGAYRLTVPFADDDLVIVAFHRTQGRSVPATGSDARRSVLPLTLRGRIRAQFELVTASDAEAAGMTIVPYFPWDRWSVSPIGTGRYGTADAEIGPIVFDVAGPAGAPGTYVGRRIDVDSVVWRAKLRDGVTWRGTVVEDRGLRVPNALVTAGSVSARTDADGAFVLHGVDPRQRDIEATADGMEPGGKVVDPRRRESIAVEMRRLAALQVKLVLPEGTPAPTWYRVAAFWRRQAHPWDTETPEDRFAWEGGTVRFSDWMTSKSLLAVFVPGHEVALLDVAAQPGMETVLENVSLEPAGERLGIVVDESGATVGGAEVALELTGDPRLASFLPIRTVETEETGAFRIQALGGTAAAQFVVRAPGYAATPQKCFHLEGVARVVLGTDREFRGRWNAVGAKRGVARIRGPFEEVYALAPIAADGSFQATVPLRPADVEVIDSDGEVLVPAKPVPETYYDGDVFLIG